MILCWGERPDGRMPGPTLRGARFLLRPDARQRKWRQRLWKRLSTSCFPFRGGVRGVRAGGAAGAPFREVFFGNRAAFELLRHDSRDIGVRVQPFDEANSRFAIGESAVE